MFLPHPFNWAVGAIHFLLEFGPQFVAACSSGVKTTVDYQYIHLLTPHAEGCSLARRIASNIAKLATV
jgi:hypothetical protein